MKLMELKDSDNEIYNLDYEVDKEKIIIRWKWPKSIGIVYILKINNLHEFSTDDINENNVKLYTKEEYKEFNGYVEDIKEINQYKYWIFPAMEKENDIVLLKQQNSKNQIIISTGKPEIFYEIMEIRSLRNLFSKEKTLQIILHSEVEVKKDALCYVKKYGDSPINREDGIGFDFISDIHVGKNVMPEINVDKNEYIKVFINNIEKYGKMYSLNQR